MEKTNKLGCSTIIAFVALLISFASLSFSYWVYNDSQREDILLRFEPYQLNPIVFLREKDKNFYPLDVHLDCIIINTGNRPVNIVSHNVYKVLDEERMMAFQVEDSDSINFEIKASNLEDYYPMAYSFYAEESVRSYLPFSIDVGQSLRRSLRVTLEIDEDVHNILSEHFNLHRAYDYAEILKVLMEYDVDIFGNEVGYFTIGEGESFDEFGWYMPNGFNNMKNQRIKVEFITGRGNVFSEEFNQF